MLHRFFKDTLIYGISSFVTKGISVLLIPFYTRALLPSDYGVMDFISVLAFFAGVLLSMEVYQAIARFFVDFESQEERIKTVSTGLLYTSISCIAFVILVFLFSDYLSVLLFDSDKFSQILRVSALSILFSILFSYVQNVIRYELKSIEYVVCSLVNSTLAIVFSILFVLILRKGVIGVFYGQLIGNFFSFLLSAYYGRANYRFIIDRISLGKLLKFSFPLVPSAIGVYAITFVDRLLIKHFTDFSDLGIYGMGYRIASISALMMVALNTASTPLIYANYKNGETPAQLSRLFQMVVFGALIITLVFSVFAKELLMLFTTPDYYGAAIVIPFLTANGFLSRMYDYTPGLSIAKKTNLIAFVYVIGALFNVLLNLVLIPLFGILGAAIASLLTSLSVFLVNMYYSQKLYFIPYNLRIISISCLSTSIFVVLGYHLEIESFIIQTALKITITAFSIMLLFVFKLMDFRDLISFFQFLRIKLINLKKKEVVE